MKVDIIHLVRAQDRGEADGYIVKLIGLVGGGSGRFKITEEFVAPDVMLLCIAKENGVLVRSPQIQANHVQVLAKRLLRHRAVKRGESATGIEHARSVVLVAFITVEKEQTILSNGAADSAAHLLAIERRFRFLQVRGNRVNGLQSVGPEKAESRSMKGVAARLGNYVHHATNAAAVFRLGIVGDDLEFLHRLKRQRDVLSAHEDVGVI